ncbi:MAG: 50S ribosomal protein L6, partial [Phycisphaerales bacterium]|nr:50S ribosomal protein L6 [Phycisphaerales bacterium]
MSRLGKKPVEVPSGVKVNLAGQTISVEGPKGSLSFDFRPEVQ